HCAVTRPILKEAIDKNGLSDKVLIPADGETLEF
ncbi:MBL fold metallo-hydrolase, partial [Vibrio sp. F13]